MSGKRTAVITVALISSIFLVFTAADLICGDRLFSDAENRMLASKPEFSLEALLSGSYTRDYDTYLTDQFVGRDKWIRVKTCTDLVLQKEEIGGVYLGADGYLIEQHLPENYSVAQETQRIDLLERLVKRWDAKVMLAPTADNILTDKLPAYALCYDETRLLAQVAERIGTDHYVDVYTALREHAGEEIYYRTDHHWTSLGAYYGFRAWAEAEGVSAQEYDTAELETVTEDFLGTLYSKVNLPMQGDAIQYFPATLSRPMTVTYDFQRTADTCYEASHLETRNQYAFFLDDNHAFIEIATDYHNGRTLFVIKDSYANCFVPLLIPYYEKIYVMDLRYYRGRLFGFMEKYEPEAGMDVLVLYNCIHFLEDFLYLE